MYSYDSDVRMIEGFVISLFLGIIIFLIIRVINKRSKHIRRNDSDVSGAGAEHRPAKAAPNVIIHADMSQPTINDVKRGSIRTGSKEELAEIDVDEALQTLNHGHYIVFRDLIIPTGRRHPSMTQIDHVIVSIYGVFCVETKSNSGFVYGYTRADQWTQYLARQKYKMNSPYRQNMHHVKSIERYLHGMLRAPVHSYLAFPNAQKVVIDGIEEDTSPSGVMSKIQKHTHTVYDLHAVERIAKSLAYMASKRDELRDLHIDEVRRYLHERVGS